MEQTTFPWSFFRSSMVDIVSTNEGRCSKLFQLIDGFDAFVGTVLNRPLGIDTARPQDYLACLLLVRSFRLMIGGVWLAASGYSELSPNLSRTIWEIAVRLFYSDNDPLAATFGFFIHAESRKLEPMEAELAYRISHGEDQGELAKNCHHVKDHRKWLESVALKKGVNIDNAVATYGKLKFRQVCRDLNIEKAYHVNYAFDSGHIHERDVTTDSFLSVKDMVGEYELGPTMQEDTCATIVDLLRNFALVTSAAAALLEDNIATMSAESLQKRLNLVWEEHQGGA